jgi:hypothetical protein
MKNIAAALAEAGASVADVARPLPAARPRRLRAVLAGAAALVRRSATGGDDLGRPRRPADEDRDRGHRAEGGALAVDERLERNKRNAIAFYDLMFNQVPAARSDRAPRRRRLRPAQPARRRRQAGVHRLFREDGARIPRQERRVQARRRRGRPRRPTLPPALARRPGLRGNRHLPRRRQRQGRRALGCAAGRRGAAGERQRHVLMSLS